ncbi:MAG: sugar phosphate isomerase/epimerase [Lachnospiraceae bacterium]|nr:sugar phosphate isomerase/epimerase [Lachnospiraceae bacterium]
MRKIGIFLHAIKLPDEEYINIIADQGFCATFTVMMEKKRHVRVAELLAKKGIEYETIHAPFGHINDMWLDCEGGETMYQELTDCIDCCVLSGAPIMVVHLSSGQNPPPVTDIGRERFTKLVEYAGRKNIRIAFENQRMLSNVAWAMESFGEDAPVGFCWDCGHEACFTPGTEYMQMFGKRLICTHIHDNFGVYNQDDHLIPFDGVMDYKRVAEHIRNSGFTGSLMLELAAKKSHIYDEMPAEVYLERAASAAKRLAALVDG